MADRRRPPTPKPTEKQIADHLARIPKESSIHINYDSIFEKIALGLSDLFHKSKYGIVDKPTFTGEQFGNRQFYSNQRIVINHLKRYINDSPPTFILFNKEKNDELKRDKNKLIKALFGDDGVHKQGEPPSVEQGLVPFILATIFKRRYICV